jgi:hypothetical protein
MSGFGMRTEDDISAGKTAKAGLALNVTAALLIGLILVTTAAWVYFLFEAAASLLSLALGPSE